MAQFIDLAGKLYEIERKVAGVDADAPGGYRNKIDLERLRVARDTESRPAIAAIEKWILEQQCIPGGKLKAGLAYVAGRWTNLTKFLSDPGIPLDNNVTEAGFVGIAQGRRNYVGCRTERGMIVATTFSTPCSKARASAARIPTNIYGTRPRCYSTTREPMLPHMWLAAGSPSADSS